MSIACEIVRTGVELSEPLPLLDEPRLRHFLNLYLEKRGPAGVMHRQDLDLRAIASLLPHIFIYDFDEEREDFRLRLAGEEIRMMLPRATSGAWLDTVMPPEAYNEVRRRYLKVVRMPAVMAAVGRVFLLVGGSGTGARLVAPLADEAGRVTQIIGATIYGLPRNRTPGEVRFLSEQVALEFLPLSPA